MQIVEKSGQFSYFLLNFARYIYRTTQNYRKIYKNQNVFFIGRGIDYPLCLEGALKLKEISYIHCEGYGAGELKHGTISLIEEGTVVVAIATDKKLYNKMVSNIKEVRSRGAFVIAVVCDDAENIKEFADEVRALHGEDIAADRHYVRMVNDKAFQRVTGYLNDGTIIYGGHRDAATRFIEPTLIENVPLDSPLMTEEIFGPIFPIITLDDSGKSFKDKAIEFVTKREKPLAFYYFGKESEGWEIVRKTSSGGGCINDVIMHIANENAPFGGVGNSGMGRYHDKDSFEAFSHTRSIIATGTWIDLPFRYMPYRMFSLVKKLL